MSVDYRKLEISSDFADAKSVEDAIVLEAMNRGYDKDVIFALRLSLEEALSNAIRHGNRGEKFKKVLIRYLVESDRVEIYVRDEGAGFNPSAVPDPTLTENLENPTGRGIMLMRAYMSRVEYNEIGNEVHLVKLPKAG